jgi:hypothetical protein
MTVSAGDWLLLPFIVAVNVTDPAARAAIGNVAEVAPDATATEAGTVATAGLLLASVTVVAAAAAADSVTVPCPELPTASVDAFKVRDVTPGPEGVVGLVELLPQLIVENAVHSSKAAVQKGAR